MSSKKAKIDAADAAEEMLKKLKEKDGHKKEFIQAAEEITGNLSVVFERHPEYVKIMERLLEPERVIQFRVAWVDDKGQTHVNRGWRVQYSSTLGPFKGGLRFHPSVTVSVLEFLGLEQIFKNSLTGLPLGGGKGGSDFDPKGKSDGEVMRFCQAFMQELYKFIGPSTDVPAGDIGVGGREIGYLFGMYKKLTNGFEGILTGKPYEFGGSLIRPEATGYGLVYFAKEALETLKKEDLKGKKCVISGGGNVALHCAEKLLELGATVLTLSDSEGYIHAMDGITKEMLKDIKEFKTVKRGRFSSMSKTKGIEFVKGSAPQLAQFQCDLFFPCATQNEVGEKEAKNLVEKMKCKGVFEGANMPCTNEAIEFLKSKDLVFGPAKACNAGGVAVSGLEMSQNSSKMQWKSEEVDERLKGIMHEIFVKCTESAAEFEREGDLQFGANVAGFLKVAKAMNAQGIL